MATHPNQTKDQLQKKTGRKDTLWPPAKSKIAVKTSFSPIVHFAKKLSQLFVRICVRHQKNLLGLGAGVRYLAADKDGHLWGNQSKRCAPFRILCFRTSPILEEEFAAFVPAVHAGDMESGSSRILRLGRLREIHFCSKSSNICTRSKFPFSAAVCRDVPPRTF